MSFTDEEIFCRDKLLVLSNMDMKQKLAWTRLARQNNKVFLWFKEESAFVEGIKRETRQGECPLTQRELEVVSLVADGYSNKDIGEKLILSSLTVKSHLARMSKLLRFEYSNDGAFPRCLLVATCIREGWIE